MTNPKFIVWCGQDLNPKDEEGFIFPKSGYREFILPETDGGPNYLRNLVNNVIKTGIPTIFLTRFEFVVSEFALNVSRKTIARDDVVFRLVHEDRTWSEHRMDVGLEFIGDNWPFGVLW